MSDRKRKKGGGAYDGDNEVRKRKRAEIMLVDFSLTCDEWHVNLIKVDYMCFTFYTGTFSVWYEPHISVFWQHSNTYCQITKTKIGQTTARWHIARLQQWPDKPTQRQQDVCAGLCGEKWHQDTEWLKVTMEISWGLLTRYISALHRLLEATGPNRLMTYSCVGMRWRVEEEEAGVTKKAKGNVTCGPLRVLGL